MHGRAENAQDSISIPEQVARGRGERYGWVIAPFERYVTHMTPVLCLLHHDYLPSERILLIAETGNSINISRTSRQLNSDWIISGNRLPTTPTHSLFSPSFSFAFNEDSGEILWIINVLMSTATCTKP